MVLPRFLLQLLAASLIGCISVVLAKKYQPTWESIESRPIPQWFEDVKFGIFCHWSVFSVHAKGAWLIWWWYHDKSPAIVKYMEDTYGKRVTYADLAPLFTAEYFDPKVFRDVVEASGAKYFVLTSKHCEGYCLWPSKTAFGWNSVDVGPKRDLVGELRDVFKGTDIHYGLYFALMAWFHPLYLSDTAKNQTRYIDEVIWPQMREIAEIYQPDIFWADAEWTQPDTYWKSKEFIAWLYNESPMKDKVVTNDRWGTDDIGKHGGYLTFYDGFDPGYIIPRKWESCNMLDKANRWSHRIGIRSNEVLTQYEIIQKLVRIISCNGNLLLNFGPSLYGTIEAIFEERLRSVGDFVKKNGEAIYGTRPWIYQNDTIGNIWYTSKMRNGVPNGWNEVFHPQLQAETIVYAFILNYTGSNQLELQRVHHSSNIRVSVVATGTQLVASKAPKGIYIDLAKTKHEDFDSLSGVLVLKIENAATRHHNPVAALIKQRILDRRGRPLHLPKRQPSMDFSFP